jgi:hypothetical protein
MPAAVALAMEALLYLPEVEQHLTIIFGLLPVVSWQRKMRFVRACITSLLPMLIAALPVNQLL